MRLTLSVIEAKNIITYCVSKNDIVLADKIKLQIKTEQGRDKTSKKLGVEKARNKRSKKIEDKVKKTIQILQGEGKNVNPFSISKRANIHYSTAKKYYTI